MKVLALTEYLPKALQIWKGLQAPEGTELWLLVSGSAGMSSVRYYIYNFWYFLHLPLRDMMLTIRLLFKGRLAMFYQMLHDRKVLRWVKEGKFDVGLHNTSAIYRQELISLFKLGIINPHIGKLPEFRGRSVMEWSLLYGRPTGITAFFIDAGIDTGRQLISFREVDLSKFRSVDTAKEYLFSQDISVFSEALECIIDGRYLGTNDVSRGKRYYVLSKLLKGVVQDIMNADVIKE